MEHRFTRTLSSCEEFCPVQHELNDAYRLIKQRAQTVGQEALEDVPNNWHGCVFVAPEFGKSAYSIYEAIENSPAAAEECVQELTKYLAKLEPSERESFMQRSRSLASEAIENYFSSQWQINRSQASAIDRECLRGPQIANVHINSRIPDDPTQGSHERRVVCDYSGILSPKPSIPKSEAKELSLSIKGDRIGYQMQAIFDTVERPEEIVELIRGRYPDESQASEQ